MDRIVQYTGFGAIAFLLTIYPIIKEKPWKKKILYIPVVFLGCMFIATLIELITSYLCEWTLGSWPWQTYADYKFNFQARIALSPSIRFGLGGTIFLYVLQPLFEKLTSKLEGKKLNILSLTLLVIFGADLVYSFLIK